MTMTVTNKTRRQLKVILPPGIIAQGATGQFGGMGGGGGGMGGGMGGGGMAAAWAAAAWAAMGGGGMGGGGGGHDGHGRPGRVGRHDAAYHWNDDACPDDHVFLRRS